MATEYCWCPCQCFCEGKGLLSNGLCQDCIDGRHEVLPEGFEKRLEMQLELCKTMVTQFERVLYTRRTYIGRLEYTLEYFRPDYTEEAIELIADLKEAVGVGYKFNAEEYCLWNDLNNKLQETE